MDDKPIIYLKLILFNAPECAMATCAFRKVAFWQDIAVFRFKTRCIADECVGTAEVT